MPTMTFLPELQTFLKGNGKIYTVRKYLYDKNVELVFIPGVGGCRRELVLEDIIQWDLKDYYAESGFNSVEDWWDKIIEINHGIPDKLHLYKVEVVRRL